MSLLTRLSNLFTRELDGYAFEKTVYASMDDYVHDGGCIITTIYVPSYEIYAHYYNDMKEYRDGICAADISLFDYQSLLGNIINPDTPYKGMIVFHGLGTGKTCAGVAIAEKFKPLVQKYNTKMM